MTGFSDLPNYDKWLEAPYQRMYANEPPSSVEDLLGVKVYVEEEDDYGTVESWETWEDADEDGRYGGYDLILEFPNGRTMTMPLEEVKDLLGKERT